MCSESCYLHSLVCGPTLNNFWSFFLLLEGKHSSLHRSADMVALGFWSVPSCSACEEYLFSHAGTPWRHHRFGPDHCRKVSVTVKWVVPLCWCKVLPSNCFIKSVLKHSKATCSKTRYVCISVAEVGLLLGKVSDKNSWVFKVFSLMLFQVCWYSFCDY